MVVPQQSRPQDDRDRDPTDDAERSGSGSDPDELPTMVISSQAARPRDDSARGTTGPPGGGPGRSRLLTGLIGGVVATGILGLAAFAWILRAGDGHGNGAAPAPLAQPGKAEDGGTQGPVEASGLPRVQTADGRRRRHRLEGPGAGEARGATKIAVAPARRPGSSCSCPPTSIPPARA